MKIYLVQEDDDGMGSAFVGYFATKIEATRALRQAIKNRFDGEQEELRERKVEYYDDDVIEDINSRIGGRPRKIQAGEITKLEIKGKHSMINALNAAISWGGGAAGGFDA